MARKAFTVIEVMLMALVFVIIAATAMANFSSYRGSARLRAAAQELAAHIKQAQTYAYTNFKMDICSIDQLVCGSGSACDPTMPTGCASTAILNYGVDLDSDSDQKKYIVFADAVGDGFVAEKAIPNGVHILPNGITFDSITPITNETISFSYNSANAAPFVACSTDCITTIVLLDALTGESRTVVIHKQTGEVSIN